MTIFSFLGSLYNIVFYQPLLNGLALLYLYLPGRDFGIAIIALTFLVRAVLYPLSARALKAQLALADLQPKLKEIQQQHKNDKDQLNRKTFELFRRHNVNPFAALLPVLVQLPLLLALFQLFKNGFHQAQVELLYGFVPNLGTFDPMFLGILNLSSASLPVAVIAGFTQFLQGKLYAPPQGAGSGVLARNVSLYFFSFFTGFILVNLPSALGLYWISTNIFSVWQQWYLMKKIKNQKSKIKNT